MKLYIIGNGFDLAHNLPTRYWDFRCFLEKYHSIDLESFEEAFNLDSCVNDSIKLNLLWHSFEENLSNINEELIIDNTQSIDLMLESGDVDIVDILEDYYDTKYKLFLNIQRYLKQWIRTIKIRELNPITTNITKDNGDYFINFNYTSTLENVYHIAKSNVIHIHGSLHNFSVNPIIGHRDFEKIMLIDNNIKDAENNFDEKEISIYRTLKKILVKTFKDIDNYIYKLDIIKEYNFSEIIVLGHSCSNVDSPYLKKIDSLTNKKLKWKIYYHCEKEIEKLKTNLINSEIDENRINIISDKDFYDLK